MHDNKQQIEAVFKRLRNLEFNPLRQALENQIEAELNTLKTASEPVVIYRVQGAVRAYEKLLEKVTEKRG
ncbi:hypothetical protein [Turicimonas muris]|uniref:hypothetical protein n=1 Tax=Turicimonas muris TaxID=1796652 RepID=UPI0023F037A5|nr:hypothetical protein [Turicimonas muris]